MLLLLLLLCFFPAFCFCSLNARLRSKSSANHVNQDELRDGNECRTKGRRTVKKCVARPRPLPFFWMYISFFFFWQTDRQMSAIYKTFKLPALCPLHCSWNNKHTGPTFPNFPPLDSKTGSYLFFISQQAAATATGKNVNFHPNRRGTTTMARV